MLSKIKINDNDINYLLDFIKPTSTIPIKTSMSVCASHIKSLSSQLHGLEIYPSMLPELKKQLISNYHSSIISPGESIGITCAQSIGEKGTQSTLNTFHSCGVSDRVVNTGVPRLQELLNSTKIPKIISCKIFYKSTPTTLIDIKKEVGNSVLGITLKFLSTNIKINMNKEPDPWYSVFFILYKSDRKSFLSNHCITITLDLDKLFEYKLTSKNICDIIEEEYIDSYVVFSPPQLKTIDIYFNMENIEFPSDKISDYKQGSSSELYLEDVCKPKLENMVAFGISDISEIYFTESPSKEWYVETTGSNLYKLLSTPNIDSSRTISNNCWEIYKIFGIEAVRQYLIDEFTTIVEGINECHIKLLVDRMTYSGTISAISRYTMRQDPAGVFSRMSFEESVVNGLESAACGDLENTKGISASIVCGKRSSIGTGMIDLIVDVSKFIPSFPSENENEFVQDQHSKIENKLPYNPIFKASSVIEKNIQN